MTQPHDKLPWPKISRFLLDVNRKFSFIDVSPLFPPLLRLPYPYVKKSLNDNDDDVPIEWL